MHALFVAVGYTIANGLIGLGMLLALVAGAFAVTWLMVYRVIPFDAIRTREGSVAIATVTLSLAALTYVATAPLESSLAAWCSGILSDWEFTHAIFGGPTPPIVFIAERTTLAVNIVRMLGMTPAFLGVLTLIFDFIIERPERRHARY